MTDLRPSVLILGTQQGGHSVSPLIGPELRNEGGIKDIPFWGLRSPLQLFANSTPSFWPDVWTGSQALAIGGAEFLDAREMNGDAGRQPVYYHER